jgi:hypothetical protein
MENNIMENNIPQFGTTEFNDLAAAFFGGKPKQETTLEETAHKMLIDYGIKSMGQAIGVLEVKKLMVKIAERMYSEEEVEIIIQKFMNDVHCGDLCYGDNVIDFKLSPRQWFEQFKNK